MMKDAQRGFSTAEFKNRLVRAQGLMAQAQLDCILLTSEAEVRYFTGFLTRFWESPTRPWYLVVPASGNPVAVIPSIGAPLMAATWIEDIRTWVSPELEDDGISLLAQTLREIAGNSARIAIPAGHESTLRMPINDYHALIEAIKPAQLVTNANIMPTLRMIKSQAEISKIARACAIAGRAFDKVGDFATIGVPLDEIFRNFQRACLEQGADWVPYLAGGAGQGGYGDVISPATSKKLETGDVLMLDTGLVHDGYFCDFDRNFSVGPPAPNVADAHSRLMDAVSHGLDVAKPGATAAQVFHAMNDVLSGGGTSASDAGRLGHGLGMQLTEWPSLIAQDNTVLEEGIVLTLEPSITVEPGKIMVHEENIVVRADGPQLLSPLAGPQLKVL